MATETTITDLPLASGIDASADWFAMDRTSLNTTQRINRNTMLGITGSPVGTSDSQTLTNKIITSPTLTVLDNALTIQDNSDPTKQAQFQASSITAGQTRTYTLPDGSTTLVGTGLTQTLTGKTLTSPVITGGSIDNSTVTVDAIAGHTDADSGTIYGVGITNSKLSGASLSNGTVPTAALADSSVTPAKLMTGTGSSWAWQSWTPTWTNLTVGDATVACAYNQTGKKVTCRVAVTFGSSTSVSGDIVFSLPVTSSSAYVSEQTIGTISLKDTGTATFLGTIGWRSTTTAAVLGTGAAGTYVNIFVLSSTLPFTWTTGDQILGEFCYEAA